MAPDSTEYIHFHPAVPPLYPAILWLVHFVSPDYSLMPWIQYGALIAAVIVFSKAVGDLMQSWAVAVTLAVAIMSNVFLMRFASQIISESLCLAFILAHLALVLRTIKGRGYMLAGLTLGCACIIRPAAFAFLFALPFLPIAWPSHRWRRSVRLAFGVAVPILVACAGNYVSRGYFATEQSSGVNLLYKSDQLWRQNMGPDWFVNGLVDVLTFNHDPSAIDNADDAKFPIVNDAARNYALTTIELRPWQYLNSVAQQFYGLWFESTKISPKMARKLTGLLPDSDLERVRVLPFGLWFAKMFLFMIMLAASVWAIVAATVRRDPVVYGMAYLALTTMCYFGLVASVEVAISRYALMAWPLQCTVLIGMVAWTRRSSSR